MASSTSRLALVALTVLVATAGCRSKVTKWTDEPFTDQLTARLENGRATWHDEPPLDLLLSTFNMAVEGRRLPPATDFFKPLVDVWKVWGRHRLFTNRSFVPFGPGVPLPPRTECYEVVPGWLVVYERAADGQSFRLMVVDWNPPTATRRPALRMAYLPGGRTTGAEEGTVRNLSYDSFQGRSIWDRLGRQ